MTSVPPPFHEPVHVHDVMQQPPPPAITLEHLTVPPTTFAGAYLPNLFKHIVSHDGPGLRPEDLIRFSHLNCSYFSHASGTAPTLTQLKRHAQCLANLICTLDVLDNEVGLDPFDYLDDLHAPYLNNDSSHCKPLTAVTNLITTHQDQAKGTTRPTHRCPLTGDGPSDEPAEYVEHVNDMFEVLENMYSEKGGILSLVPEEHMPGRAEMEETIFGQWLLFTCRLVKQVASLEREVARQQAILAGEATIPHQLDSRGRLIEGKPLLFPQDRYVLANVSEELYDLLDKLLGQQESMDKRRNPRRAAASSSRGTSATPVRVENQESGSATSKLLMPITHIDVSSRIFRIGEYKTLFIVPAFELNPNTHLTREHETEPDTLIKSLPRPPPIPSPRPREIISKAAHDRSVNDLKKRIRELETQLREKQTENDRLRRKLKRMPSSNSTEKRLDLQEDLAWTNGVDRSLDGPEIGSNKDADTIDIE